MKFQSGQPRPAGAGRKKGSVNKKKLLRVEEVLLAADLSPVDELIKLLPQLQPKDAARVLLELQSYVEPKPKAVELPADEIQLTVVGDDVSDDALIRALDEQRGIQS